MATMLLREYPKLRTIDITRPVKVKVSNSVSSVSKEKIIVKKISTCAAKVPLKKANAVEIPPNKLRSSPNSGKKMVECKTNKIFLPRAWKIT